MVSNRHIFRQSSALGALGRTALRAALQKVVGPKTEPQQLPGALLETVAPARSRELIDDYIRNVGGSPKAYVGRIPPHMFPQWAFGPASLTLGEIPYPLLSVVNGGCRIESRGDLPDDRPLHISAQLVDIDDDGRRAILHQRITTGTEDEPELLVAHMYPIVVYGRRDPGVPKKAPVCVPGDAQELARWSLPSAAGLDFARLTGDFNPIHWVPPYARLSGFKSPILHGFGTMARAIEGLHSGRFSGSTPIVTFDCRFTRPLPLPADVGLFVRCHDDLREVWVGRSPGGECFMSGTFEIAANTRESEP